MIISCEKKHINTGINKLNKYHWIYLLYIIIEIIYYVKLFKLIVNLTKY